MYYAFYGSYDIACENKPHYYNFLWVLPIIYMIFFCLIMNYFSAFKYKISAILIITIYGLRMVGVPLAMSVGNYSTYGSSDILEEYMEIALLLMCWEFIVVAVFLLTQYWKKNKFLSSEECGVNKNSAF